MFEAVQQDLSNLLEKLLLLTYDIIYVSQFAILQ